MSCLCFEYSKCCLLRTHPQQKGYFHSSKHFLFFIMDTKEETKTSSEEIDNNPYIDNSLIKDLADYTLTANEQFISEHKVSTSNSAATIDDKLPLEPPKTLMTAPEIIEFESYNSDKTDYKIEQYLYHKYKAQITQSFKCFDDDIIFRFVTGYRHIDDYNKRLQETERLFSEYLAWHSASNLDTILSLTQINNVCISEYLRGVYVYGMDKYGHPVLYDEGLKYRKKSETMKLFKDCGEKGMDMFLAYLMAKLRESKLAINAFYGCETCMNYDCELSDDNERKLGITRQVLVF